MGNFCKKHGKVKDQNWTERQSHGGALIRIGCVDCKNAARNQPPRFNGSRTKGQSNFFTRRRF